MEVLAAKVMCQPISETQAWCEVERIFAEASLHGSMVVQSQSLQSADNFVLYYSELQPVSLLYTLRLHITVFNTTMEVLAATRSCNSLARNSPAGLLA
jgi:hypothetical protein